MIRNRGNPLLHFLDRYAGIPAVALIGCLKRKRPVPRRIQTIGLLKAGAIGDTVLMSAVIADLRTTFRGAQVVFFSGDSNFEIASMIEGVDRVFRLQMNDPRAAMKCIRSVSLDVVIDFGQWSRLEALLSGLCKNAFAVGFRTTRQHRHSVYDVAVPHSSEVHEIENYRQLVRTLGVKTQNQPTLRAPVAEKLPAENYAVCHLWPGGIRKGLKQWPLENWMRLIEDFVNCGIEVELTGAPADRAANDDLIGRTHPRMRGRVRNSAGSSLEKTAATLARSCIAVSVNTGVMHMAAALGVPLVALHGPTSAKRWGPVSDRAIIVESPLAGCGYLNLGWEHPSQPPACMECIRYETVWDACTTLLQREHCGSGLPRSGGPIEPVNDGISGNPTQRVATEPLPCLKSEGP